MSNLLNKPEFHGPVFATSPQEMRFTVRDKHFLLDSNSLALWQVKDPDEQVELCQVKPQFRPGTVPGLVLMVVDATNACNFRCKYCFEEGYEDRSGKMSFSTAERAIRTLFNKQLLQTVMKKHRPSIGFFGGEPMVNFELINQVVPYAKGYLSPLGVGFSMTTNASLIKPEHAAFFKQHPFSFIVSIDGPKALHDAFRIYKKILEEI